MLRKVLGPFLAVVLGLGVLAGLWLSAREKQSSPDLLVVRGLIGSEKDSFYRDPRVQAAFVRLGLRVEVEKSGSREMADNPELKKFDFAHPAGSPAAQRIRQITQAQRTYTPFFTPMVLASWSKLVPVLKANGLIQERDGFYYLIDLARLLEMSNEGKRWRELKDNKVYDSGRSILISSTDVRKSNSAAMYAALASYLFNGNNVVQSEDDVRKVLPRLGQLFLKQGFLESSSAGPFEDYTGMGMGKAPLVMVYESQWLEYQTKLARANPEMVMLYPQPTVFTKHVLVPLSEAGNRVGEAMEKDAELQKLAAEYGYRGGDPQLLAAHLKQKSISVPSELVDVIDPPSYETLERMIVAITAQLQ